MLSVSGSYKEAKLERNCLTNHQHCSFQGGTQKFLSLRIKHIIFLCGFCVHTHIFCHFPFRIYFYLFFIYFLGSPTSYLVLSKIISCMFTRLSIRTHRVSHFLLFSSSHAVQPRIQAKTFLYGIFVRTC